MRGAQPKSHRLPDKTLGPFGRLLCFGLQSALPVGGSCLALLRKESARGSEGPEVGGGGGSAGAARLTAAATERLRLAENLRGGGGVSLSSTALWPLSPPQGGGTGGDGASIACPRQRLQRHHRASGGGEGQTAPLRATSDASCR